MAVKRCPLVALALTALAAPLVSSTLERLSLDDMIAKSTAIVHGKVTNAYAAFSGRVVYTHYSVQVLERFKGSGQGLIDMVVPGGTANGLRQSYAGAPEFQPGDEYVFFLWTGPSGLTQVTGLTQGLFSVAKGSSLDPAVTRAASHEVMLAPGTGVPVKDQTLVMRLSELRSRIAGVLGAGGGSGAK
ncbi:MAG: hypothetical protein ABSC23_19215 [Bryobacteraceae bacterium]|jgi:hypothetical protein